MADNALGTLFSNIADAIRTKTANLGTMKPNEFPDKILSIAQIIHESGGEYVPPDNGDSSLKINCGYFRTNTTNGVRMQTIEHGLGTVPEFVIVYGGGISSQFMANGFVTVPKFVCAYGFHSSFASQISHNLGAVNYSIGFIVTTEKGIDEDEEKVGFITNCDSEKFLVGYGEDRNDGYYEFEFNSDYYWIAMSGIGSAASGGGSMEGVHTVTFMSEDGQTELFKRPVADGDNCADPVERKYIDPPTKESTDAQTFDHDGWSATTGGSADASILNAVTADKTVYAAFSTSTRYYTIRFFDGDTLLHTVLAEYGSTPEYTPTKVDYVFDGWTPDVEPVVGDADYHATWVESVAFADASWATIASISEAGLASSMFAIGDTKNFTCTTSGKTYNLTARIVGFDHDDLADGTGKAGITCEVVNQLDVGESAAWSTNTSSTSSWPSSKLYTNGQKNSYLYYESDLKSRIKKVLKPYYDISSGTIKTQYALSWGFSMTELGYSHEGVAIEGERYAYFNADKQYAQNYNDMIRYANGAAKGYGSRSVYAGGNSVWSVSSSGGMATSSKTTPQNVYVGFCI